MRYRIALMVIMLVAGSCVKEDMWYQKGKAESDMQIDRYECRTQLRDKYGFYGADKNTPAYAADLRQCMIDRGYALVEKPKK
jgi:hypothetical protein